MRGTIRTRSVDSATRACTRTVTPTGLVVLGQGTAGAGKTLIPLAFQDVEVQGKLYEKGGVKYLDITSAEAVEKDDGDDDPDEGDGE